MPNSKQATALLESLPSAGHAATTPESLIDLNEKDSMGLPRFGRCIITGQLTSNRWFPKRPPQDDDVGFPYILIISRLLTRNYVSSCWC